MKGLKEESLRKAVDIVLPLRHEDWSSRFYLCDAVSTMIVFLFRSIFGVKVRLLHICLSEIVELNVNNPATNASVDCWVADNHLMND